MVLDSREKAVENSDLHSTVLLPWSIKSIASKGTSPLINAVSNRTSSLTAAFNNRRTLKFKAQPTNAFFATVNQMFSGSSQLPTTAKVLFRWLNHAQRFDYRELGSSRKPPDKCVFRYRQSNVQRLLSATDNCEGTVSLTVPCSTFWLPWARQ